MALPSITVLPEALIVKPFSNVEIAFAEILKLGTSIFVASIIVVAPGVPTVNVEPPKSESVILILVVPLPKSTIKFSPTLKSPS